MSLAVLNVLEEVTEVVGFDPAGTAKFWAIAIYLLIVAMLLLFAA